MIEEPPEPAQHPTFNFSSEPDHDVPEPEQDSRPKLNLSLDLSDEEKAADENKKQDAHKAIRKPRIIAKLDAEKLLSADGLPKLLSDSRKLKFKGKGHEASDLEKLLSFFQLWGHNLFPKLKFKSFVDRAEKICKEKRTRVIIFVHGRYFIPRFFQKLKEIIFTNLLQLHLKILEQ
jgi:replication fork protection complex subunit Csm3/Swi3